MAQGKPQPCAHAFADPGAPAHWTRGHPRHHQALPTLDLPKGLGHAASKRGNSGLKRLIEVSSYDKYDMELPV